MCSDEVCKWLTRKQLIEKIIVNHTRVYPNRVTVNKEHSICVKNAPRTPPNLATELNPDAPTYALRSTTSTLCSTGRKAILLQTARTVVHNPLKPDLTVQIRLLFDTGSQRSYLTEGAMKLLQLRPIGMQMPSIATFGALQEHAKVCLVVTVNICLKDCSAMCLMLHVVATTCEPLSHQPITASIEVHVDDRLMGSDLVDSSISTSRLPVDILIG